MVSRSTLACILGVVLAFGFLSAARAQGPDVQIVQLDCNSDPEVVVIQNLGDAAQDLSGWKLESDPPGQEAFDLFGSLKPGESTSIALGQQFVYRDDDPSDYARIVDDTGAAVHQVNCAGGAAAEPSPTPTASPAPSPTASPEASPPGNVPNGGGPPPVDSALPPSLLVLVGGSMVAAGLAAFALPQLRLSPSPAPGRATASSLREEVPANRGLPGSRRGHHGEKAASLAPRLALISAAVTIAVVVVSVFWRERPD